MVTISDEQLATLRHLLRFRVTTQSALKRMLFAKNPGAIRNHLQRLRDRGLVESSYVDGKPFYGLTGQGLKVLGERTDAHRPIGGNALMERFGVLEFCARSPSTRSKYRGAEFVRDFPELSTPGVSSANYYLDLEDEQRKIGWIHVHRTADPRRDRARLVRNVLERRSRQRNWRAVFENGLFALGLVVPTQRRADDLRELLAEDWGDITLRVEVEIKVLELQARQPKRRPKERGA